MIVYTTLNNDMPKKVYVCKDPVSCLDFGSRVFKIEIPDNCKIEFDEYRYKFYVKQFTIIEEIDMENYWNALTENKNEHICILNQNFDFKKYSLL